MIETNSWVVVEANLVPFLLRSVYHSFGMLQNEESENNIFGPLELDKDHFQYPTWSLPMPVSCHILAIMLDVALSNQQIAKTSESIVANGCVDAHHFAGDLIWGLCSMAEHMLPERLEHRTCAISFLLPIIFKAFASHPSFEAMINGKECTFSRYSLRLLTNVIVLLTCIFFINKHSLYVHSSKYLIDIQE